jgi:DNA-binding response OmpR family regulator
MRLLVIEDNETLSRSLRQGFQEEGFAVDVALDGEEGLWYAQLNPYDVIVLDLTLPRLDGLELLRELRSRGVASHVICLTARGATEDKVHALNLGADDYLAKPFAFEELLARVRSLCRRAYQRKDPVIRIADLEINTAVRSVRRGETVIQLSAREYALLEFLAFHAGEVVTRTMVWDHLYDFADESVSNVVDVYVCLLRKKIDGGSRCPLIHTRRGEGYVLQEVHEPQRHSPERKR